MANKPNNPSLWSKAKSMAKQKYDVYPSAYANGWAAKWYKSKGGTWRSKAKESEYIRHMYQTSGPFNWSSGSLPNNVPVAKPQSTIGYGHSQTQPSITVKESAPFDGAYVTEPLVIIDKKPTMYEQRVKSAGKDDSYKNLGKNIASGTKNIAETVAEFTGIPGAVRFFRDPLTNLQGAGYTLENLMMNSSSMPNQVMGQIKPLHYREKDLEGMANTVDAVGLVAPFYKRILPRRLDSPFFTQNTSKNPLKQRYQKLRWSEENISNADVNNNVVESLDNKTLSKDLQKQQTEFYNELLATPRGKRLLIESGLDPNEGLRRLKNMGLKPEDIKDRPFLTFDADDTYYDKFDNRLNIDYDQLSKLDVNPYTALDHESGHWLQNELRNSLLRRKINLAKQNKTYNKYIQDLADKYGIPFEKAAFEFRKNFHPEKQLFYKNSTALDDDIAKNIFNEPKPDILEGAFPIMNYARESSEPFAFVREMRRNLMNTGALKHRWHEVTDDMLDNFMKSNTNDRVSQFLINNPDKRSKLLYYMNNFPALVPTLIGGSTAATLLNNNMNIEQKKYGGMTQKPKRKY
jgi:hypothetical protein